jgi:hypothetical protein
VLGIINPSIQAPKRKRKKSDKGKRETGKRWMLKQVPLLGPKFLPPVCRSSFQIAVADSEGCEAKVLFSCHLLSVLVFFFNKNFFFFFFFFY